MKKKILIFVLGLLILSCEGFSSSKKLTGKVFLLRGDKKEGNIIVFCTKIDNGSCNAGTYLIPKKYEEHYNKDGRYIKYVEKVSANQKWGIVSVRIIESNKKEFWIIDKSFNDEIDIEKVRSFIYGPYDYKTFLKKKYELKIELDL